MPLLASHRATRRARPWCWQVKELMVDNLARLLQTDLSRVNVKARTHEKVDSVGECRALECHVVLIMERDPEVVLAAPPVEA